MAIASPIHRLDARVKVVTFVTFSMLSFFIDNVVTGLYWGFVVISIIVASRIPIGLLARSALPFAMLLVFSFVANVLLIRDGTVLFTIGPLSVGMRGVETGVLVSYRAAVALAFGVLLVSTTSPVALADALESLLAPLRHGGVPVQDVAMILSIALRTIPVLSDEASDIARAQRARCAWGPETTIGDHIKAYAALAVPLLAGSLRHAERLACAMETRCYGAAFERTHLHPLGFLRSDRIAAVFFLVMGMGFVVLAVVS